MIYFIQEKDPPHRIKVGFSDKPLERIAEITAGFSQHMTVLKVIEGTREDETWLHRHLKYDVGARVEGKREWYHPYPEMLDYVNSEWATFPGAAA